MDKKLKHDQLTGRDRLDNKFDCGTLPCFVLGMDELPHGARSVEAMIDAFEWEQIERWQESAQGSAD